MSHIILIALAIVSIAVTTCRALPDIHKQMSAQQLQSIFQVEHHDAVPQYEVIQLLHHHNEELSAQQYSNYRRRKRSIQENTPKAFDSHHVKKDLSKTSYYSEIKMGSQKPSNHLGDIHKGKPVKHIDEHKVQVHAFGEKLNLTLKKTQGLFKKGELHNLPMWFMEKEANATHGINLEKIVDEHSHSSDKIGEVYQDEENMAAILMRRHEITGDLIMEGSIGHDMVIKPLPHELSPQPEESHHVIYKRSADQLEHLSDFAFMEPDDLSTHEKSQERSKRAAHRNTLADLEVEQEELEAEDGIAADESSPHKRGKRHAPYMIYPEVLVIVDYDGYRLHGGDNLQVKRYFIAFWNGVDLRYRLLKEPKIRVSIAGIIISRGRDATPYLERNRVGRDAIDSAAALTDMGKYLFRERRLPVYDIAVAITKYDMCRRRKGGRCTKGTAGFAYVGGACVVNRRLEKVNSVAIIEDTGGFSGIIVAAHEVGHLLGAVHDGSPPPSYLGGPGAQRCRWEDGFIMSDLRHTERGFRWSACSVQSFQHFLNGATATCLYNVPHEDNALGRSLPGTLLSLDAQCRRDRGTYACFKDERVCAQLFCFDAQTGYCVAYRPAAEGSTCGNNLHCLDGRCTALPVASNLITNYGGQYRLGYKSNEAIGEENENKAKELTQGDNANNEEDEDDDDEDDDDEEDEDEDEDNDENKERKNEKAKEKEEKQNSEEYEGEDDDDDDEEDDDFEEEDPKQGVGLKTANDLDEDQSDEDTSDSYESQENDSSSVAPIEEGDDDNDDDEEYLTDEEASDASPKDLNGQQYEHNHIDRPHDNRYEESMVKSQDNEHQEQEDLTVHRLPQRPLMNMNTYQYLSQLWKNLHTPYNTPTLGTKKTTTATATATQKTATTKKPLTVLHRYHQDSTAANSAEDGILKSFNRNSGTSSDSRRNSTTARNTQQHYYTDNITTYKPRTLHMSTSTITTTTTTTTPSPNTSTLIKTLRKQFQYYVKLLQANTDSNRSRSSPTTTSNHNKPYYNSPTILPSKPYSNSLNSPAASKHLYNLNKAQANANNEANQADEEGDNEDDDEDSGDDNDESNETIEKQKRKLTNTPSISPTITTTTTTSTTIAMQQQASPPIIPNAAHGTTVTATSTATSILDIAMATTTAAPPPLVGESQYGLRSPSNNPTLFDSYVKKLQALGESSSLSTESSVVLGKKTTPDETQTLDKTERSAIQPTSQLEAQYLKRTPTLSSSVSTKNPYGKKTTSSISTGSHSASANGSSSPTSYGSSSYKFISQPLKNTQEEGTLTDIGGDIKQQRHQTSSQTSVATFSNYIGDNTNRLASIVQQQQQTQQHAAKSAQPQHKTFAKVLPPNNLQQHKTSLTSTSSLATGSDRQKPHTYHHHHQHQLQQQQSSLATTASATSATTRRPKIKTQKLIRRLRTQIK